MTSEQVAQIRKDSGLPRSEFAENVGINARTLDSKRMGERRWKKEDLQLLRNQAERNTEAAKQKIKNLLNRIESFDGPLIGLHPLIKRLKRIEDDLKSIYKI